MRSVGQKLKLDKLRLAIRRVGFLIGEAICYWNNSLRVVADMSLSQDWVAFYNSGGSCGFGCSKSLGEVLLPALGEWPLAFKPTHPSTPEQWAHLLKLKGLNWTCPWDVWFEYQVSQMATKWASLGNPNVSPYSSEKLRPQAYGNVPVVTYS